MNTAGFRIMALERWMMNVVTRVALGGMIRLMRGMTAIVAVVDGRYAWRRECSLRKINVLRG